jgi:hypothetical protein
MQHTHAAHPTCSVCSAYPRAPSRCCSPLAFALLLPAVRIVSAVALRRPIDPRLPSYACNTCMQHIRHVPFAPHIPARLRAVAPRRTNCCAVALCRPIAPRRAPSFIASACICPIPSICKCSFHKFDCTNSDKNSFFFDFGYKYGLDQMSLKHNRLVGQVKRPSASMTGVRNL